MNVLLVGSGKGSWAMRGEQLGAALGARVVTTPSDDDLRWADVVVLVKRAGTTWGALVHRFDKPIVWDALDFWSQPLGNRWTAAQAHAQLHAQIQAIRPALVIGATQAMAEACGGVYLPHHTWAGLAPTPARETVTTVAYEGNVLYLGRWVRLLETQCAARGWQFVLNPPDLAAADLLVALRDGPWDGWICRQWKSGVKLGNAIAAGRPVITQESAAFRDLLPVASILPDAQPERYLGDCLDYWASADHRRRVVEASAAKAPALTLAAIAARYRLQLAAVSVCAA